MRLLPVSISHASAVCLNSRKIKLALVGGGRKRTTRNTRRSFQSAPGVLGDDGVLGVLGDASAFPALLPDCLPNAFPANSRAIEPLDPSTRKLLYEQVDPHLSGPIRLWLRSCNRGSATRRRWWRQPTCTAPSSPASQAPASAPTERTSLVNLGAIDHTSRAPRLIGFRRYPRIVCSFACTCLLK